TPPFVNHVHSTLPSPIQLLDPMLTTVMDGPPDFSFTTSPIFISPFLSAPRHSPACSGAIVTFSYVKRSPSHPPLVHNLNDVGQRYTSGRSVRYIKPKYQ